MKIGYIRVSTQSQNTISQEEELKKYNVEKYFIDKSTGRSTQQREQLNAILDFCRDGDVIYCYDFSRISRSLKDLLMIIDKLHEKNVSLVSIKENLDTTTKSGLFMVQVLGAVNQYQIDLQREKIMDGIAEAKRRNVYKGRKAVKIPDFNNHYNRYMSREINKVQLSKELKISRTTLDKLIKEHEKSKSA